MEKWNEVPAGVINAATQRIWVALGDQAGKISTRINTDPRFVDSIARFMIHGENEPYTSQEFARLIMDNNFFGVEEAMRYFGINPTSKQIADLTEVPFNIRTLLSCRNTHNLVAVFPLSILNILSIATKRNLPLFKGQDKAWFKKELFATEKGEMRWLLVRRTSVPKSEHKTWEQAWCHIGENEEIPTARIVVYTAIGHFLASGERLFGKIELRCLEHCAVTGGRIYVGVFDELGLDIDSVSDGESDDSLGLAGCQEAKPTDL